MPFPGVRYGTVDVTDDASVSNFVEWVLSEAGKIDILINNARRFAGRPCRKHVALRSSSGIRYQRFRAFAHDPRCFSPPMRAARSGLIINISSVLGFLPAPFMGVYASSKHALEGLSESLDHEIREFNVRVVLLEPTFTNTKLDVNAAQTAAPLGAYATQADATIKAVQAQIRTAPSALAVAEKILAAINGPYRMRQPAGGQATLLSRLRRFMPASAVDSSLRKTFGFGKRSAS